jgi:hypothetical protein
MKPEIVLDGREFKFSVPLGSEPASLVGGSPTWEEVARPSRTALTNYTGQTLLKVDVPVLLDGWPSVGHPRFRSVQDDVDQILRLCRSREANRPPDFTASGPIPYSGTRFVMELPDWGDGLRADEGTGIRGELVRQALVLHLTQFIDPDTLRFRRKGAYMRRKGGTITLKEGETLLEVSARIYGDTSWAKELALVNGIKDVRKKLPAGTKITLAVAAIAKHHSLGRTEGPRGAGKKND